MQWLFTLEANLEKAPHCQQRATPLCSAAISIPWPAKFHSRIAVFCVFLEPPEFKRSVLKSMRKPLEERRFTISRATNTLTFREDFTLINKFLA
jgi:hypothetical protein